MNVGESQQFEYTGDIQTFTIPHTGIYKLEVYGARGGTCYGNGTIPQGGYSKGYKNLSKGTVLYICCGGAGGSSGWYSGYAYGGYNGGGGAGSADYDDTWWSYGAGGGATHIAFVSGTLASIGKDLFDQQGLIVAGGGVAITTSKVQLMPLVVQAIQVVEVLLGKGVVGQELTNLGLVQLVEVVIMVAHQVQQVKVVQAG